MKSAPGMEVERPEFRHHVGAHEHVLRRQRARIRITPPIGEHFDR